MADMSILHIIFIRFLPENARLSPRFILMTHLCFHRLRMNASSGKTSVATSDDIDRLAGVPSLYDLLDGRFAQQRDFIEHVREALGIEQGLAMIVAASGSIAENAREVRSAMLQQADRRIELVSRNSMDMIANASVHGNMENSYTQKLEESYGGLGNIKPFVDDNPPYYLAKSVMVEVPPRQLEQQYAAAKNYTNAPLYRIAQAAQDSSLFARDMLIMAGPNYSSQHPNWAYDVEASTAVSARMVKAMSSGRDRFLPGYPLLDDVPLEFSEFEDAAYAMDKMAMQHPNALKLPNFMQHYEHYRQTTLASIKAGLSAIAEGRAGFIGM